ncbi:MAG: hypothetical protein ACJA0I_000931 [Gammaproteobacteria bacterium]|jgi:hypothetical protein
MHGYVGIVLEKIIRIDDKSETLIMNSAFMKERAKIQKGING